MCPLDFQNSCLKFTDKAAAIRENLHINDEMPADF